MNKGLQKSLLSHVLGLFGVMHHAASQMVNLPLVFSDKFLEGREVALLGPGYEVRFSHGLSSPGLIDLDR